MKTILVVLVLAVTPCFAGESGNWWERLKAAVSKKVDDIKTDMELARLQKQRAAEEVVKAKQEAEKARADAAFSARVEQMVEERNKEDAAYFKARAEEANQRRIEELLQRQAAAQERSADALEEIRDAIPGPPGGLYPKIVRRRYSSNEMESRAQAITARYYEVYGGYPSVGWLEDQMRRGR